MDKKLLVGITSYWIMFRRVENKLKSIDPKKQGFMALSASNSDWKQRHTPEHWKQITSSLPLWLLRSGVSIRIIKQEFHLNEEDIKRQLRNDQRKSLRYKLSAPGFDLSKMRLTKKHQAELKSIMDPHLAREYYLEQRRFRR